MKARTPSAASSVEATDVRPALEMIKRIIEIQILDRVEGVAAQPEYDRALGGELGSRELRLRRRDDREAQPSRPPPTPSPPRRR